MEILYIDDSLVLVNKPPGVATVPGGWGEVVPSAIELLEADLGHLWIVHRLDKVTSGIVLFARTAEAHRALSMLFERREVRKTFDALICGVPAWDEHTARHNLRTDVGHRHRTVVDHSRGISAVTNFRVLERFTSFSLLEATTETGRIHQVRAHAAALGFPLLADTLYGAPDTEFIPRPALHACSLSFRFKEKSFSFTAPYPKDFDQALINLGAVK